MEKLDDGQYRGELDGNILSFMLDGFVAAFEIDSRIKGHAQVTFRIVDGEVDEDSIELVPED